MQTELYVHYLKELNWLAVAASALAYFFLGAVWYSPVLFSKTWVRLSGVKMNEDSRKKLPMMMLGSVLISLVMALTLALLLLGTQSIGHPVRGVMLGGLVSVGIAFTAMALNNMYESRPLGLLLINWGYNFAGSLLICLILSAWK